MKKNSKRQRNKKKKKAESIHIWKQKHDNNSINYGPIY